jgi:ATP-binding cassette subfamily F protein uup
VQPQVKEKEKQDNKSAASNASASSTAVPKQKKLSFKEQRDLEQLPKLIAELEAEQGTISAQLSDPELYRKEPDAMKKLNQRFAEIDALLLDSLEKWEAIEARTKV